MYEYHSGVLQWIEEKEEIGIIFGVNPYEPYLTCLRATYRQAKGHEVFMAACPASGTGFQPVMTGKMPVPPGLPAGQAAIKIYFRDNTLKLNKNKILPAGKLPIKILERFLKQYAAFDESVVVGPGIGLDAAVIKPQGGYLIAKTDPITFVSEDIGLYAININANDIAAMGGVPKWFLATILLPEGRATINMAEGIFAQLSDACKKLDISFCGGHTEITSGILRPIVIGQMLGEAGGKGIITAAGARTGDNIIITKGIAIEAVSIMAREMEKELAVRFGQRFVSRCKNFIKYPGIGVLKDSMIAVRYGRVNAMHDPTEGGIAAGLNELAIASKAGIIIDRDKIPVFPECKRLCDYFGINPLGAIASGSLLISAPPEDSKRIITNLKKNGIKAVIIGRVVDKKYGVNIRENNRLKPMKVFERDEITRIF
ncbi:MAG TPA: hydrogenase expression/formation protein [Deltaproteobacteria bacterium]|nr:hydrogenase expression/formation protein [Deltaproteobacteria bacterium]